jgi:hypothetical protein
MRLRFATASFLPACGERSTDQRGEGGLLIASKTGVDALTASRGAPGRAGILASAALAGFYLASIHLRGEVAKKPIVFPPCRCGRNRFSRAARRSLRHVLRTRAAKALCSSHGADAARAHSSPPLAGAFDKLRRSTERSEGGRGEKRPRHIQLPRPRSGERAQAVLPCVWNSFTCREH